jgi:ATP-dependent RNA helicase DOB1
MYISKASTESKVVSALKPCGPKEEGEMRVVPCFLNLITKISSVRLYFNEDLRPLDNRMEVYKRIQVRVVVLNFVYFPNYFIEM